MSFSGTNSFKGKGRQVPSQQSPSIPFPSQFQFLNPTSTVGGFPGSTSVEAQMARRPPSQAVLPRISRATSRPVLTNGLGAPLTLRHNPYYGLVDPQIANLPVQQMASPPSMMNDMPRIASMGQTSQLTWPQPAPMGAMLAGTSLTAADYASRVRAMQYSQMLANAWREASVPDWLQAQPDLTFNDSATNSISPSVPDFTNQVDPAPFYLPEDLPSVEPPVLAEHPQSDLDPSSGIDPALLTLGPRSAPGAHLSSTFGLATPAPSRAGSSLSPDVGNTQVGQYDDESFWDNMSMMANNLEAHASSLAQGGAPLDFSEFLSIGLATPESQTTATVTPSPASAPAPVSPPAHSMDSNHIDPSFSSYPPGGLDYVFSSCMQHFIPEAAAMGPVPPMVPDNSTQLTWVQRDSAPSFTPAPDPQFINYRFQQENFPATGNIDVPASLSQLPQSAPLEFAHFSASDQHTASFNKSQSDNRTRNTGKRKLTATEGLVASSSKHPIDGQPTSGTHAPPTKRQRTPKAHAAAAAPTVPAVGSASHSSTEPYWRSLPGTFVCLFGKECQAAQRTYTHAEAVGHLMGCHGLPWRNATSGVAAASTAPIPAPTEGGQAIAETPSGVSASPDLAKAQQCDAEDVQVSDAEEAQQEIQISAADKTQPNDTTKPKKAPLVVNGRYICEWKGCGATCSRFSILRHVTALHVHFTYECKFVSAQGEKCGYQNKRKVRVHRERCHPGW